MRIGLVIVGIAIVLLGLVPLFEPIVPLQSQSVTSANPDIFTVAAVVSPTGNVQLTVTWSSTTSTTFAVYTCTSVNLPASNVSTACQGPMTIGSETGTSGTFHFPVKLGSSVIAGIFSQKPGTASVTVTGSSPLLATVLLVVGLVLVLIGGILKKKAATQSEPPTPTGESPTSTGRA
ncbi:MAG: hypothetical protein L3K15_06185 [Thermoplasmata archaeon]|nr:hypothetical protein [Thermoplasmata archaeon]